MLFQWYDSLILTKIYLGNIIHKLLQFAILYAEIIIYTNKFLVNVNQFVLIGTRTTNLSVKLINLIFQSFYHNFIRF